MTTPDPTTIPDPFVAIFAELGKDMSKAVWEATFGRAKKRGVGAPMPALMHTHDAPASESLGGVRIEDAKAGGGVLAEASDGGGVQMKGVEAGEDIIASSTLGDAAKGQGDDRTGTNSGAGNKTDVREVAAGRDVTIIGQQTIHNHPPSPSPTSPPDPPSRSHPPDREYESLKEMLASARRYQKEIVKQYGQIQIYGQARPSSLLDIFTEVHVLS